MARNAFTVHQHPRVLVHADDDQRKRVTCAGDPLVYGDQDVTFAENDGKVKDANSIVLSTARFFISEGTTDVTVEDVSEQVPASQLSGEAAEKAESAISRVEDAVDSAQAVADELNSLVTSIRQGPTEAPKADVKPPADRSRTAKKNRSEAAKKAAQTRAKKNK